MPALCSPRSYFYRRSIEMPAPLKFNRAFIFAAFAFLRLSHRGLFIGHVDNSRTIKFEVERNLSERTHC
jgi:hypothetical protein